MKRLLFSLMLLTAFVLGAQGRAVYFNNSLVEFKNGTEPQIKNGHKYYQQDVWWTWNEGDTPINLGAVHWSGEPEGVTHDLQDVDFDWSVEVLSGDLSIPEGYYDRKIGQMYVLKNGEDRGSHIYFDGTKGILKVTATNPDFEGEPYTCSYEIRYHLDVKSKKWDFYSKAYSMTGSGWTGEQDLGSNNKVHWFNNSTYTNNTSFFDGKVFVKEAEGLNFKGNDNQIGGYNPEGNNPVENRYLALKKGVQLQIPASTWAGYSKPRIRIKMGRYGTTTMNLIFSNARDALGKLINTDYNGEHDSKHPYGIGGSVWWGPKGDNNQRGEYHFQIKETNNPFTITVGDKDNVDSDCLLLYSIEVYDSDEMITENSVLGEKYQFLHSALKSDDSEITGKFYLHYRGSAEKSRISHFSTTGTVGTTDGSTGDGLIKRFGNTIESTGDVPVHNFTSKEGEFGTFRMRIEIWDHHKNYCTDYAYRTQSVGYMQKKDYPYTWDFTDVAKSDYWNHNDSWTKEQGEGYAVQPDNNYFKGETYIPRNVWETATTKKWSNASAEKSGYGLKVAHDAGHNVLFCGGSQLWRGDEIIPETAGLAFEPVNYDATYNSAMIFSDGGMTSLNDVRDWWLWRITVPQVTKDDVIYVRAKKLVNTSYYNVGFVYGDATNKTEKKAFGTEGSVKIEKATETILGDNEVVYAIPSPSSTQNVTLFFAGVEVQKIAVSRDPKTVNKYGWATESRARVIDPELTSYMTGYDFESCPVTALDFGAKTVTLDRTIQNNNNQVMAASSTTEKDNHAYIIHHKKDVPVQILDGKFHLFVPDMHDYDGTANAQKTVYDFSDSKMTAQLSSGNVSQTEGSNTNFVLTWQYARYDKDGKLVDLNDNPVEGSTYPDYGYVGFFMVQPDGVHSNGNQGYLPIPTSQVSKANNFTLVYNDETNGIDSDVKVLPAVNDNVYYSVSGQKLDGVPTQSGIYIVNGKKVVIK